ncbi:hypothetical protein MMC11_003072 [Xylographa trunciseda]|nr:hypothetical protein [Xylographa trunciseda]
MSPSAGERGHASIIDIRRDEIHSSILDDMQQKLRPAAGEEKKMPTLLLYDEKGLNLFEDITYLEEYYLTNAEIDVLSRYADRIADRIADGSQLIELGSGNLRKVIILLNAIERSGKRVDYYALDLSLLELQRTLSAIPKGTFTHVRCYGLHGTYDDGLEWLKLTANASRPRCVMWLGSSIGNFNRDEAARFLKGFASALHPRDSVLIGIDGCQDAQKIYHAYNDREGKTHEFVLNGLTHANRLLGKEAFNLEDWEVLGEYDQSAGRHQAFCVPKKDVQVDDIHFASGERVRIEESYKYSVLETERLWEDAGLTPGATFVDQAGHYYIHMLSVPQFVFSLEPVRYAPKPSPSLHEFEQLWAAWDMVTISMIPYEELLSKPIKLRNCCLFYLGHIPTFLDIHLTRATNGVPTEPSSNRRMFERGIDPDVDNPELCHEHSEIPDEWPPVKEILSYQDRVRERTRCLYNATPDELDRKLGRALWLAFEHEVMHLETLLYMLLQSDKTIPPRGVRPDFEALADQARINAVPNAWFNVPANEITIGFHDPENDLPPDRYFGWDNERPLRSACVGAFEAKARGITNADYALYLEETGKASLPASWILPNTLGSASPVKAASIQDDNGVKPYMNGHSKPLTDAFLNGKAVRTVYGPVPLIHALDWPAMASYDELAGCAKWMGGRIPTMEEARSLYYYVEQCKAKDAGEVLASTIPAVNGHLSNEGVEESPPSHPSRMNGSSIRYCPDPRKLFANLEGCNVGFKHYHPMPITQHGNKLCGQSEMGGAWEWTSSILDKHDGFIPMDAYPAYTGPKRRSWYHLNSSHTPFTRVSTEITLTPTTEHKCATCKTVLSSPRAKKSCFGIHEFVCPGYHGTLHRPNSEHKCDACRMASEQHIERIREIATLDHNAQERMESSKPPASHNRRRSSIAWGALATDESSLRPPDSPDTSSTADRGAGAAFSGNRKDKKAEQSARRAKAHAGKVVTADDLARWEAALHPPSPERSEADAATIAAALSYTPHLFAGSAMRQDAHAKKVLRRHTLTTAAATPETKAAIVDALLAKLDIVDGAPRYAGKEGKLLGGKLRALVEAHLTVSANEERHRMQRMEGYWRYVNRRAYNRMVRRGELWDWGTGGKLVEIEESEGSEGSEWDVEEEEEEGKGEGKEGEGRRLRG